MRRILAIICSIILIACCFAPLIAFAEDAQVSEGQGTTTTTYTHPSDYCIIIPDTIDSANGAYVFQAASLNISYNEYVLITVSNADSNNRIIFTHEDGSHTLTKQIVTENVSGGYIPDGLPDNCVGYFTSDESASALSFAVSEENYDYQDNPKAGTYTATVEFNIYLSSFG